VDDALARIVAVREGAPRAELLLDGNAGFSATEAVALLRALEAHRIRPLLFEQPCAKDDVAGLLEVAAASEVPVALDESASSEDGLAPFDARFVVNVKPMKAGFAEASRIVRRAREKGMRLMIGGMVETRMAMGASACLVARHGAASFAYVDLDTPLFLATDPWVGGYAQEGERLDLGPVDRGHGCVPREDLARA